MKKLELVLASGHHTIIVKNYLKNQSQVQSNVAKAWMGSWYENSEVTLKAVGSTVNRL